MHTLPKSKPDNIYITCQIDHPIHSFIFIEQQVIIKGFMEVFTFTNFYGRQTLVWPSEGPSRSRKQNESNIIFRQVNRFH